MTRLTLDYMLEGSQRGYAFTSPTDGLDDESLKAIWRSAMPRGQGWGTEIYTGSRSIKGFALPDGNIAVSEVTVTNQADESGRRGLRQAVIDVMSPQVFHHHLRSRIASYPQEVQREADSKYIICRKHQGRMKRNAPLVLAYPFTNQRQWWVMEMLLFKLMMAPIGPMRQWDDLPSFTTLALNHRNESRVVALPAAKARDIRDAAVVKLY